MLTATIRDDSGVALGIIVLSEHAFSTGSKGFFGAGKIEIDGKRHQVQVQLVEIGSKTQPHEKDAV